MSAKAPEQAADSAALQADDVAGLQRDLGALAETLGRNFSILDEHVSKLDAASAPAVAALERRLAVDEARLAALEARARAFRPETDSDDSAQAPGACADDARAPDAALSDVPAAEPASPAAAASFLAFKLPSQSFELDRRRRWTVAEGLSRAGFDGKSTLHDFSGATTVVSGEIVVNPARPAERPEGKIVVDARSLGTGLADRDEEMREKLATERFPSFEYELEFFELAAGENAAAGGARGTVHGRMTIRGVARDFALPVRFEVDASRRLLIEGSAPLLLSDYGVPVPNKLGLVKMEDEVTVWVALRARAGAEVN